MITQAIIAGAGYSYHAGLPLQAAFTDSLLAAREFRSKQPSKVLVEYLDHFIEHAFGHVRHVEACFWPELEDLFTCVDLSANTGHHLGAEYKPSELRTVRRVLIARIMRMLTTRYRTAQRTKHSEFRYLEKLLAGVDLTTTAFVNMNWDIVTEDIVTKLHPDISIRYGAGAIAADFPEDGNEAVLRKTDPAQHLELVKMHGSVNWLYCDSCRRVYWFPTSRVMRIADQMLSESDWICIQKRLAAKAVRSARPKLDCPYCSSVELGTRIATFSYRKALDFPMFQRSWNRAERILRRADRWVFIGYSLPAADFEFKYLMKRVQLARRRQPKLMIITGDDTAQRSIDNYLKFFGAVVLESPTFESGIDQDAIDAITSGN